MPAHARVCVCVYLTRHSKFCSPSLEHCLFFQDLSSSADGHSMIVLCVCVSFRIRSSIVAIRENLWVHIQCICRFACFSCHGRIHGTLCVCVCVCVCVCARLCVWGYCLYRLLVLMFRSVLACVNMKLFGSVHAIAMLYIIVCMCAFPRTV